MQILQRLLDRVVDGTVILAEIAIALMMLHITAEVCARWIFFHSFDAVNEIVAFYYMAGLTFMSLAYITRGNGHIVAEIFTDRMAHRPRELLEGVTALALAAFMAIFAWQTFNEAMSMTRIGELYQAAEVLLPKWPARWYPPTGSALMALYALMIGLKKLAGEAPPAKTADFKPAAHE